jgi:hypothetical protein
MHSETPRHQVRDGAGERESMEILRGETMGRLKSFTPSGRHVTYVGMTTGTNIMGRDLLRFKGQFALPRIQTAFNVEMSKGDSAMDERVAKRKEDLIWEKMLPEIRQGFSGSTSAKAIRTH